MRKLAFIVFWVAIGLRAEAQLQFKFRHIDTKDGLSQTTITSIQEDYFGYIWLGTRDGLNRYDGSDFKVYRESLHIDVNHFNIISVAESADSTLWVSAEGGGLCFYDRGSDTFLPYTDSKGMSVPKEAVFRMIDDGIGHLVFLYGNGESALLDQEADELSFNVLSSSVEDGIFNDVASDKNGNIWLGTDLGEIIHYKFSKENGYRRGEVESIAAYISNIFYHEGKVWVATNNGLFVYNTLTKVTTNGAELHPRLGGEMIHDVNVDKEGFVWVGTSIHGLLRYDPKTQELLSFQEHAINQNISDDGIREIYCDGQNNVWIGTFAGGVNLFSPERHRFDHYVLVDPKIDPNRGNNVPFFSESSGGSVWIANGGRLSSFKDGHVLSHENTEIDLLGDIKEHIHGVHQDSRGNMWLETRNAGLILYEKAEGRINQDDFKHIQSHDFFEDSNGNLFVAHSSGVAVFDQDLRMRELSEEFPELKVGVNTVMEDNNGEKIIGTERGGIYRYNEYQNQFYALHAFDESAASFNVQDMMLDSKGQIWMATFGLGLLRFDQNKRVFEHPPTSISLPSNIVKSLEEDALGRIWFSSNMGISCYNPDTGYMINFNTDDGLQGDEFIAKASMKDEDGKLFFGGFNGFNYFDPLNFLKEEVLSDIHVSDVSFLQKESEKATFSYDPRGKIRELDLPYFLNDFTIALTSKDFYYKENPSFWYKLKGYRDDWVHIREDNKITLTNLDPGYYELVVDPNTVTGLGTEASVLRFNIASPPWRTPLAYFFYGMVLVAVVVIYRNKTLANERLKADLRIKEIEAKKVKELNELKSSFFTHVSHEFRTPITLLMGPLESMMQSKENDSRLLSKYRLMHKNAKLLLRLINQILDISKIEFGHMPLLISKGNIIDHIRDIYSSFEYLADTHHIRYTFACNYHNLRAYFDKDKVEKIIYNLLSNAFKFTKDGGEIGVVLNIIPSKDKKGYADRLTMTIKDNGVGISQKDIDLIFSSFYQGTSQLPKREYIGTGIGLSLTKQLVELHKGKITVESAVGQGSAFTVEIPLYVAAFEDNVIEEYLGNPDRHLHLEYPEDAALENPFSHGSYENYDQILVIDDNADILDYLQIELGNQYKIYQATDGKAGYEMALRNIPDLIITDIMMPEMDGYELCQRLKNDPRTNHVPIILISALSENKDKIKGLGLGADDYITKPFNMALLRKRVENIISSRSKLRKMYEVADGKLPKVQYEDSFIQKVSDFIEENIEEPNLTVEVLAETFNITSMQLYRKIRGTVNKSPNELIRFTRLNKAAHILRNEPGKTVAEIAYQVGFNDPAYFSRCFKKQFETSPTDFMQEQSSNRR